MRSEGRGAGKGDWVPRSRARMRGGIPGILGKPKGTEELLVFSGCVWVTGTVVGKAAAVSERKSTDGKEKVGRT